MKVFIYILIALAVAVVGFNITKIDSSHLLEGDSFVAMICILAGLCTILMLGILLISKKIAEKVRK